MRRVPDILPVSMQDFMHGRQPDLRAGKKVKKTFENGRARPSGRAIFMITNNHHSRRSNMLHLYKNNGYNIVLDVNSSSVHIVDDVVYDVLELMCEKESPKQGGQGSDIAADI